MIEDFLLIGDRLSTYLFEIAMAIICGGLIGLERGLHHKAAGLRDNILICLGATLYMIITEIITISISGNVMSDPTRMAGQVITGIGFIGAGTIIQSRGGGIQGITTAATIWVVAGIGLLIGVHQALMGLLVTGITLLILTLLQGVEKNIQERKKGILLKLIVKEDTPEIRKILQDILTKHDVRPGGFRSEQSPVGIKLTLHGGDEPRDIRLLIGDIWTLPGIIEVEH